MWLINKQGEREFAGGKEDWIQAALVAQKCGYFRADDEDEMVADEPISCYNCLFRRWTARSFACYRK